MCKPGKAEFLDSRNGKIVSSFKNGFNVGINPIIPVNEK